MDFVRGTAENDMGVRNQRGMMSPPHEGIRGYNLSLLVQLKCRDISPQDLASLWVSFNKPCKRGTTTEGLQPHGAGTGKNVDDLGIDHCIPQNVEDGLSYAVTHGAG